MLLNPFTFHSPGSLSEAVELYSGLESVKLQAGGTFLFNNLKLLKRKEVKTPEHIISLKKIRDLKGVSEDKNTLVINAMTTMSDLLESPLLKGNLGILKVAAKNIGTTPIRNMATIGGNLTCRYTWTEMPAIMIGLDAILYFLGPDGKEEAVPAEEFFKAGARTEKILTRVSIKKDPNALVVYRRVKKSSPLDIPLLSLFVKTNPDGKGSKNTRVAVNNGVEFGRRDHKLEGFIDQSGRSKELAQEALDHMDEPIYDTRSSDYKKHMFRVAVKSAIEEITGEK